MSREKKKGTSGNAKAFITRAKALKKLQLPMHEFRRLCILKGIYPRDPRKKFEGSDKTYYLRKDIDFLAHERLIHTIRAENSHSKKVVKAKAKRRIDVLRKLALRKPRARLDHLVLERYPRFEDAVRELDDPLCIVGLFANLPADRHAGIAASRAAKCQRLLKEFHMYVVRERALRKVFVSIKGYYFQARVVGELVTWVLPHRFSQVLPSDVDYSVMLTFLDLYQCILSFVNFRLYTASNMAYPPKIVRLTDAKGLGLAAVEVQKISSTAKKAGTGGDDAGVQEKLVSNQAIQKAQELAMTVQAEEEEEEGDEKEEEDEKEKKLVQDDEIGEEKVDGKNIDGDEERDDDKPLSHGVFADKSFVLGREVPYDELEFMLKSCGATLVTREDDLPDRPARLSLYTHWVIDRPKISGERNMTIEYVQPQYVFDSINAGVLLPTSLYGPGSHLPPHLSPFVSDEDEGGYRPWYKDILDKIKAGDMSVVAEAAAVAYAESTAVARKQEQIKKKEEANQGPSGTRKTSTDGNNEVQEEDKQKWRGKVAHVREGGDKTEKTRSDLPTEADGDGTKRLSSRTKHDFMGEAIIEGGSRKDNDNADVQLASEAKEEATANAGGVVDVENGDKEIEEVDEGIEAENPDNQDIAGGENEGEEEGEEEDEEEDEEGEEEEMVKGKEIQMELEGKELATLMLSRKKMRLLKKHKREKDAMTAVRDKLMSKRKRFEKARDSASRSNPQKKRRKKC